MKKTQLLDAFRNIRKQGVSFLSVVVIAMLAVTTYLGIAYAADATARSASDYYAEHRMWDLEVVSTLLMDDEDLAAIRATEGVELAEPVLQVPAKVRTTDKNQSVNLLSLPGELAAIDLLEGRLPESADECAVEEWLAEKAGFAVGQRLEASCAAIADVDPLSTKEYVITGVFRHPDHISRQVQFTPYVLVRDECFNLEALDGAFMKARIRIKDAPSDRYSAEYLAAVDAVEQALTQLGEVRAPLRVEKLRESYSGLLEEQQKKLDEAEEQLKAGRKKLDDGWAELAEAAETLAEGKDKLDSGGRALYDASIELKNAEAELRAAKQKLDVIEGYVDKGRDWVLNHVKESDWPPDAGMSYAEFMGKLNQGKGAIMKWIYDKTGYSAGLYRFKLAEDLFSSSWLNWYYLGEEYMDGVTLYDRGKKDLDKGEADYNEGLAKYEDGLRQLEEAQRKIDAIGGCRWVVLDNEGNAGYVFAKTNSRNIAALSTSFSLIFIVIGALVIYATVGRMVEEQSKLVGATKAMGLFNREIFGKYLFFGGGGTVLGVGLGILASYYILQKLVLNSQGKFLTYGAPAPVFLPVPTLIVALGGVLLSVLAVRFACTNLLRLPAIRLMQGSANLSKLQKASGKGTGGLYRRLILLNMRTDSKRVLVTIVSVAGCCILLVVGFYIKFGISSVNDRQFGPEAITRYDAELYYDASEAPDAEEALAKLLKEHKLPAIGVRKEDVVFRPDAAMTAGTLLCAEPDELGDFYALRDADSGAPMQLPDSGVLIPKRMRESYGLNTGDSFSVYDNGMDLMKVKISGVFNNHVGHVLVFSPAAYREAFGTDLSKNCFLVKTGDMTLDELETLAASVPGFETIKDAAAEKTRFNELSSMVSLVIVVMILIAGLMAYFIIVNLSKTYIQKKSRELTIMRINGFTTKECVRYAAWDLIITTVVGTALGLVLGGVLGRKILCMMEQAYIQFVREPDWRSFVLGALITLGFSWIINAFALRRVKHLKLSDIA